MLFCFPYCRKDILGTYIRISTKQDDSQETDEEYSFRNEIEAFIFTFLRKAQVKNGPDRA